MCCDVQRRVTYLSAMCPGATPDILTHLTGPMHAALMEGKLSAKWQFVGATGKIIDHVHFPISRRGGSLNDPSFQYRQRSFSSGHGQRYSMVGETFCIFYIMLLWIILLKAYENAHLLCILL